MVIEWYLDACIQTVYTVPSLSVLGFSQEGFFSDIRSKVSWIPRKKIKSTVFH